MTSHDLLHTYSLVLPERAELEQDVGLATQDYYNTYPPHGRYLRVYLANHLLQAVDCS